MSKQTFLQGTFILIIAGLITKILGFVNKIVVARIMGEEGVGLYMMAVPTLLLVITLTRLGLPVAISKLVAEAEAERDYKKMKRVLLMSLSITTVLSIIFTTALIFSAPILSKTLLTDSRTFYPLIAIAPVVPIVALSSVLRGYFQGRQNMRPSAYSQVIEQVVRITLVALLTKAFLPYGIAFAAAGAMVSVVIGELASLLFLFSMFKFKKKFKLRTGFWQHITSGKKTLNEILGIALPTTGSQLIGSISYFLEPIVVAQSLYIAGVANHEATKQYGELAGLAIPLLLLPTFVTFAISTSLVPAISEAAAQKHYRTIDYRLNQALRFAMISGGISVVITYIFAVPILKLMYDAPAVASYVKIMSPFFFFLYFQAPLAAALQALDLAKAAMINSFIGAVVKITAIFALATNPDFGIMGAALAIMAGITLVTLLHFATILKAIPFTIIAMDYVKGFIAIIITGFVAAFLYQHPILNINLLINTIFSISITVLFYFIFSLFIGIIKNEDLQPVPVIGKWFQQKK
jgi:stage V sporulation protein B